MGNNVTPADEKCLALIYALTAVVKTLIEAQAMDRDHLFSNLSGARQQLEAIGESGAATLMGALNESLLRI